jgi:transcriptional regulator with GAF, ATPase, and Fis domain
MLADHRLESELFGHVRGAFAGAWRDTTGLLEAAERGTALLDDVDELPPDLQTKLLRFLEEGRLARVGGTDAIAVSTRIIAATSHDLEAEIRAGRFREDLFYRLNVIVLRLPPLR